MSDVMDLTVRGFLAATAAKQPTPGGGAVTALCGALAASLGGMALAYTTGKKSYAAHEAEIRAAMAEFAKAGELFQELVAEDIAAYEALSPLLKLPPDARAGNAPFETAVVAAIRAPQTTAGLASAVLERCSAMLDKTNRFLVSDLGIAGVLAHAAVHASELNVRVNLPLLPNQAEAESLRQNLHDLAAKADRTYEGFRMRLMKLL